MKTKMILLVLLAALPLMGSDCVNSGFSVAIDINGVNGAFPIKPGGGLSFAGADTIKTKDLYDHSYTLTGASVYDIKVRTVGPDLGTINGDVFVNNSHAFNFHGKYTDFNVPQSLITSTAITRDSVGLKTLIDAIRNQSPQIILSGAGTITTAPAAGDTVYLQIFVQAIGQL